MQGCPDFRLRVGDYRVIYGFDLNLNSLELGRSPARDLSLARPVPEVTHELADFSRAPPAKIRSFSAVPVFLELTDSLTLLDPPPPPPSLQTCIAFGAKFR